MSFTEEEKQELLEKNFSVAEDGWSAQKAYVRVEKGCQMFWVFLYNDEGDVIEGECVHKVRDSSMLREF